MFGFDASGTPESQSESFHQAAGDSERAESLDSCTTGFKSQLCFSHCRLGRYSLGISIYINQGL